MFDIIQTEAKSGSAEGGSGVQEQINVDMLAVCNSDGSMQPLRFRFEDEDHELRLARVLEVLSCREIRYVNVEAYSFSCRAKIGEEERILNLRYSVRSHRWWLNHRRYPTAGSCDSFHP